MELIIALVLFIGTVAAWLVLPANPAEQTASHSAVVIAGTPAHRTA